MLGYSRKTHRSLPFRGHGAGEATSPPRNGTLAGHTCSGHPIIFFSPTKEFFIFFGKAIALCPQFMELILSFSLSRVWKRYFGKVRSEKTKVRRVSTIAIRASRFLLEYFLQVLCSRQSEERGSGEKSLLLRDFEMVIHAISTERGAEHS